MAAIISKAISAVVLALAETTPHQTTPPVDPYCACAMVERYPSDYADMGDIVLRAKVLSRRVGEDDDGHLTNYYKIRATTFYSGGSDVEYRKRLYFSSSARSSIYDCRVDLRIGGDYLLSLFHNTSRASDTEYSDQGGALTVNACALDKPWTSVFDTEKEELARLLERNDDEEDGYYDDDDSGRKLRGMMA